MLGRLPLPTNSMRVTLSKRNKDKPRIEEDERGALTRAPFMASLRGLCLRRVSGANTIFCHLLLSVAFLPQPAQARSRRRPKLLRNHTRRAWFRGLPTKSIDPLAPAALSRLRPTPSSAPAPRAPRETPSRPPRCILRNGKCLPRAPHPLLRSVKHRPCARVSPRHRWQ